jgi:hypothetical protein
LVRGKSIAGQNMKHAFGLRAWGVTTPCRRHRGMPVPNIESMR